MSNSNNRIIELLESIDKKLGEEKPESINELVERFMNELKQCRGFTTDTSGGYRTVEAVAKYVFLKVESDQYINIRRRRN